MFNLSDMHSTTYILMMVYIYVYADTDTDMLVIVLLERSSQDMFSLRGSRLFDIYTRSLSRF